MGRKEDLTIKIKNSLMHLESPKVMGILNVTDNSFYKESRKWEREEISSRVRQIIEEGGDIIDVGGCSTRPGFSSVDENEEYSRVMKACEIIRNIFPDVPLSIDTFRASIAEEAIRLWGADIINDISGGIDPKMFELAGRTGVVYILTHNSDELISEKEDITASVIIDLSKKIDKLHSFGVKDIIIDPGFGFAKTLKQNFKLLSELGEFCKMGYPLLAGLSRKSMIYKSLGVKPEEALTGTIALNAIALEKGANILRVHDVKEAVETKKLFSILENER